MRRSGAVFGQKGTRPRHVVSLLHRNSARALALACVVGAGFLLIVPACWAAPDAEAGLLGIERQRETATRQLERARAAVEIARSAAAKSKGELDAFLMAHFETMRSRATETLPAPSPALPSIKVPVASNREAEQLNAQINELKSRRDDLLQRYTTAHPEVADVESRLGDLMLRLSSLEPVAENAESLAPGKVVDAGQATESAPNRQSGILKQQQIAAAQYEQHLERWQAAEDDLKAALEAEERAVNRLAAIQLPAAPPALPPAPHSVLTGDPSTSTAAPTAPGPSASSAETSRQQGSQPLALAALLIALAVAALAAVKLARSSGDVYFENVDDVAAALALPVVGTISAIDNVATSFAASQPPATRLSRQAQLACELSLAVVAFALVAYGVQNPAALWHACTHPLESLGNLARNLGD